MHDPKKNRRVFLLFRTKRYQSYQIAASTRLNTPKKRPRQEYNSFKSVAIVPPYVTLRVAIMQSIRCIFRGELIRGKLRKFNVAFGIRLARPFINRGGIWPCIGKTGVLCFSGGKHKVGWFIG